MSLRHTSSGACVTFSPLSGLRLTTLLVLTPQKMMGEDLPSSSAMCLHDLEGISSIAFSIACPSALVSLKYFLGCLLDSS